MTVSADDSNKASRAVQIKKNVEASRYELRVGDELVGLADYVERGEIVVIPHTETKPAFGGRGLASQLVRFALEDIAAQSKKVNPACPFVAVFLQRNPEFASLRA
jgi:predicted GNAT family acetyltransferase